MAASLPHAEPHPAPPGSSIDCELFLDCVHCGLCTAACPTYRETANENDSPRGRIYLMRGVVDGAIPLSEQVRAHLDLCLDCRACETACPSGVEYGRLIEPFRAEQAAASPGATDDWFRRLVLLGLFPFPERLRMALWPARLAQRTGLLALAEGLRLTRLLPRPLQRLVAMLPPARKEEPPLPERLPAKGTQRARVALFTGCVADVMFRSTHWATARALQENGCEVLVPRQQVCCGAIHLHAGAADPARRFADANARAFRPDEVDAVIVNVAGCGSMLKEYPHSFEHAAAGRDERDRFAAKVRDVHEFLDQLGPIPPRGELRLSAVYHDACHLTHAQKITEAPRKLLRMIPGLVLRDLPESELCCGAAGTYNLTQPEMSDRLARRKLENIERTGATTVVTANAGCLLQIAREARRRGQKLDIVHPLDLLDRSYRGGSA